MTRFVLINIFKLNSTEPGLLGVLLDEATRTTAQSSHVTITPTTIFAVLTGSARGAITLEGIVFLEMSAFHKQCAISVGLLSNSRQQAPPLMQRHSPTPRSSRGAQPASSLDSVCCFCVLCVYLWHWFAFLTESPGKSRYFILVLLEGGA